MNRKLLAALFIASSLATAADARCPPRRYITSTFDRFTGVTATRSNFLPLVLAGGRVVADLPTGATGSLHYAAGPIVPNILAFTSDPSNPPEYGVLLTMVSGALRYKSCFTSYILADQKPVATLTTRYLDSVKVTDGHQGVSVGTAIPIPRLGFFGLAFSTSTSGSTVATETIGMTLDAEAIAQLGAASKIEFKVCNDEIVASPQFVQAAHELACKVEEQRNPLTTNAVPGKTETPSGLCPAQVIDRLKVRGLTDEAIQEICKP